MGIWFCIQISNTSSVLSARFQNNGSRKETDRSGFGFTEHHYTWMGFGENQLLLVENQGSIKDPCSDPAFRMSELNSVLYLNPFITVLVAVATLVTVRVRVGPIVFLNVNYLFDVECILMLDTHCHIFTF